MAVGIADDKNQPRQFSSVDSEEIPLVNFGPDGEIQMIDGADDSSPVYPTPPNTSPDDSTERIATVTELPATDPQTTANSPSIETTNPFIIFTTAAPLSGSGYPTIPSTPTATFATTTDPDIQSSEAFPPLDSTMITPSTDSLFTFSIEATLLTSSTSVFTAVISSTTVLSSQRSISRATSFSSFSFSDQTMSRSPSPSRSDHSTSVHTTSVVSSTSSFMPFTTTFPSSSLNNSGSIVSSFQSSTSISSSASATVTAPPLVGNQSNLNVHEPPYYVGIAFGVLAGLALLAALIAWFIRIQSHARRRRRAARTMVPWANPDHNDAAGLEAGRHHAEGGLRNFLHWGSREDMAHVQTWTPSRDRDVGEPKCDGYFGLSAYSRYNPHGHRMSSCNNIFSEGFPTRGASLRQLPSHLIDERAAAQGRPLAVVNGVPASLNPSYRSSYEHSERPDIDQDYWDSRTAEAPLRPTMVERLKNLGNKQQQRPETPLDEVDRLPTPGGSSHRQDVGPTEAWASSLRSSLANAFNAVAANLSMTAGAPRMSEPDDDRLTAPPRRNNRKSIKDTFLNEKMAGESLGRGNSTGSKAWTLEETRDGAGVVHLLNISQLDQMPQRPAMDAPQLSFGDGQRISTYGDHGPDDVQKTMEPHIPLVASSKPLSAYILDRPEDYLTRRSSLDTVRNGYSVSVSRASSVYSTASMPRGRSLTAKYASTRIPPLPSNIDFSESLENTEDKDSVVIHPDDISRLDSTDSSATLSVNGQDKFGMRTASDALKDRRWQG